MSMADGSRVALPVVNVYKYLGPPLRYDLRPADLVKELLCTGHAGVKSVLSYVNRHDASVSSAAWMWGTFVDSALKARAAFVPMTTEAMAPLCRAQLAWGRAILGWDETAPANAVLGDLGWIPWPFMVADAKIALLQRLPAPRAPCRCTSALPGRRCLLRPKLVVHRCSCVASCLS